MSANTFGNLFQVSTFGESHGPALGALIQGCPAGVVFDEELLKKNLSRRRPGQSDVTTNRNEADVPRVLSGVYQGKTLGTPIAIVVENTNQDSSSYTAENLKTRPGHATDLWQSKFKHSDPRGSGRASGRETLSRVIGGSVAQMLLKELAPELKVSAFVSQIGSYKMTPEEIVQVDQKISLGEISVDEFKTRLPHSQLAKQVDEVLMRAKQEGESYGGIIDVFARGVPSGIGQPVFKKLKSEVAAALMSIGAVQSVQIGFSLDHIEKKGSDFHSDAKIYGGVRGGLSTGEKLHFRVGFKAPATLGAMATSGRHDPCILPRAVPVIENMLNMVFADQLLWRKLDHV